VETKNRIILSIILVLVGYVMGTGATYLYYSGQLGLSDTELGEYRERVRDLEQQYSVLRGTTDELNELLERRRDIDARAIEQVEGIGESIRGIQSQGASIAVQLRITIGILKDIKERARLLEETLNSFYSNHSSGIINTGILTE